MADTFQYKKSELVSPLNTNSSPTLKVAVNNQATRAFDNIGKAIGAYSQAKVQQLDIERKLTEEETLVQDRKAYVESSANMATYYSQYKDDVRRAGQDREKQALAHNYFVESMEMEINSLSPTVQRSLALHANGMVSNANDTYGEVILGLDREEFKNDISIQSPAFLSMDKATQKETYNSFMSQGENLGISKADFGKAWVSSIANYKISNLDVEKMVNDSDYSQLDDIRQTLTNIQEIDPKTNKDTLVVTKQLDALKNEIDSNVTKNITLALSANEGYGKFKDRLQFAVDNGAINEDRRDLYLRKWRDNNTVAQNAIAGQSGAIWNGSKGMVNLSMFDGTKLKTPLTNMTKQETLRALAEGDMDFLSFQKDKNSKLFETTVNEYVRDMTSHLTNAMTTKATTPEQEKQKAQAIQILTSNLNKAKFIGGSKLDSKTRLMARGAELASQGYLNIEQFLAAANVYEPELAPKSDDNIKSLYKENLDIQTTKKIHEDYSIFVAGGIDRKLAIEEAKSIHSYIKSDDTAVTISGGLNKALSDAGLGEDSTGAFLDSLGSQEDFVGTKYEDMFVEFQNRPNPTMSLSNGVLTLKADDGFQQPIPMPTSLLAKTATDAREKKNAKAFADTTNYDKVVSKISTFASKDVLSFWNTMSDIGFLVKQSIEPISGVYRAQVDNYTNNVLPLVEKQRQLVDTFLGEAFVNEKDFKLASDNFLKNSVKLMKQLPVAKIYKKADDEQSKKNLARWESIKSREVGTLDKLNSWMKEVLQILPSSSQVEQEARQLVNQQ